MRRPDRELIKKAVCFHLDLRRCLSKVSNTIFLKSLSCQNKLIVAAKFLSVLNQTLCVLLLLSYLYEEERVAYSFKCYIVLL